ncbi:MAG TPA: Uma2 family endonuclease [Bryobacteraceae bacterium]
MTPEQYLAIEREAEYKSEYYKGEMFAMAGGSFEHNVLSARIIALLINRLSGRDCHVCTSDMKVRIDKSGLFTYPDITVVCGKPLVTPDYGDVLLNPKLIVEVLSRSTEATDRGFKFHQYQQIESLEEYVLVTQTAAVIDRFWRAKPGGEWSGYSTTRGLDSTLVLVSLGIEIPLAEIYRGIELDSNG